MHRDNTGPVYVLTWGEDGYVALDSASGGYPYKVTEWYRAEFWIDINKMHGYMNTFHKENFKVHQILPSFISVKYEL